MSQETFNAMLPIISADLVYTISAKQNVAETEAILLLYASELYAALEQEETKLWQYSTPMLYALLEQEWKTGTICFPDV